MKKQSQSRPATRKGALAIVRTEKKKAKKKLGARRQKTTARAA